MNGWIGRLGLVVALGTGAGCVPLSDYKALEKRFGEQETYVTNHKNQVREMERREQVLTMRAREQEKQLELMRARLEKSERLRQKDGGPPETVAASTPRQVQQTEVMGLQVNPETQGLVLESGVLFASGKADLTPRGQKLLDGLIQELNSPRYSTRQVRVDGHTDDEPIQRTKGLNKSNWDLAAKRAVAVLQYLDEHGIAGERLSFGGYGPYRPFDKGKNDAAKAKTRRVEVVLFER